jgi:hypothetical protein
MSGTYSAGILPGTTTNADPDAPGVAGASGSAIGTGTGRYGFQTIAGAGMGSNPFVNAWNFINEPITTPLSAMDVFVLIGAVLVSILLWNLVLFHIRVAAEAI